MKIFQNHRIKAVVAGLSAVLAVSLACGMSDLTGQNVNQVSIQATQTSVAATSNALAEVSAQQTRDQMQADALKTAQAQLTLEAPQQQTPAQVQPTQDTGQPQTTQQVQPPPQQTPGLPTITADVNTNCREGPSPDYKVVGYLVKGDISTVHGRDASKNWWYIENPDQPGKYCWVWVQTTVVQGNTSTLAVITPPPPPVPDVAITVSFVDFNDCGVKLVPIFEVNNGNVALESMQLTLEDSNGNKLFGPASSNAPFMGTAGECPPGGSKLDAGKTGFVGGGEVPLFAPAGTTYKATIKLCSEDNLQGACGSTLVSGF